MRVKKGIWLCNVLLAALSACAPPRDAVHRCRNAGGPSVVVAVHDERGKPAAEGARVVIRDGTFADSGGARDSLHVGAGNGRPGVYRVQVSKPGHDLAVLWDVKAPADSACNYAEPTDIRTVTLRPLPPPPMPAGEPVRVGRFGDFVLRGSTRVVEGSPDTLVLEVVVTNTGSRPREYSSVNCSPVWAYRAGDPLDRPAWYSPRRRSWPDGLPVVCGGQTLLLELAPGASTPRGRGLEYPVPEILGDSLPAGQYRLVMKMEVGENAASGEPLTPMFLDLGEVYLKR